MSAEDARELMWWRTEFASRFSDPDHPLPRVGSVILGATFKIQRQELDGVWRDYQQEA